MRPIPRPTVPRATPIWLIAAITLAVVTLAWFGFRAAREWRASSKLLVQRHADQTADLLVRTLIRDMRGADDSVLRSLHWDGLEVDPPNDVRDLVSSAFARYPYPEVFFAGNRVGTESNVVFFARSDRRPSWLGETSPIGPFPVTVARNGAAARKLVDRLVPIAEQGRGFLAFETDLGGGPHQVVARLFYKDNHRDHLERVFGFIVNLAWVRESYFPELTAEIGRFAGAGMRMAILDEKGAAVAGTPGVVTDTPVISRRLQPLFFDLSLAALDTADHLPPRPWTVQVSPISDAAVLGSFQDPDLTLAATLISTVVLGVGLLLAARALRASANLTRLRSDFVASVTHELKTPLATIRAASETLMRGRLSTGGQVLEYGQILDREAKRLGRLVDNLLAYSRITDVSEAYSFESLALAELIDDIQHNYQSQITDQHVDVHVDIPLDLPHVRADRTALVQAVDNLVDNALRYSGDQRWLGIKAWAEGAVIHLEVSDHGNGIPPDEIASVTRRFVRGRHARSPGSGLGLAIASRVLADHGGTLKLESQVGKGTTVHVTLPSAEGRKGTP